MVLSEVSFPHTGLDSFHVLLKLHVRVRSTYHTREIVLTGQLPFWEHEDTATDIACKGSRIVPLWGAVFYQVCRQW